MTKLLLRATLQAEDPTSEVVAAWTPEEGGEEAPWVGAAPWTPLTQTPKGVEALWTPPMLNPWDVAVCAAAGMQGVEAGADLPIQDPQGRLKGLLQALLRGLLKGHHQGLHQGHHQGGLLASTLMFRLHRSSVSTSTPHRPGRRRDHLQKVGSLAYI